MPLVRSEADEAFLDPSDSGFDRRLFPTPTAF